jgi:hypothetical protein
MNGFESILFNYKIILAPSFGAFGKSKKMKKNINISGRCHFPEIDF